MAHALVSWAQRLPRYSPDCPNGLTMTERQIFTAICDRVDPGQGGYWFDRPDDFIENHAPFVSSKSSLRNHIAALRRKGYMETVHRGGGPKARNTYLSRTHYRILYPESVAPPPPQQFRLPLLTLIKQKDDRFSGRSRSNRARKPRRAGMSSPKPVSFPENHGKKEPKLASSHGKKEPKLASSHGKKEPKLASSHGKNRGPSILDQKRDLPEVSLSATAPEVGAPRAVAAAAERETFFEDVATACAERGIRGVRSSLFDSRRMRDAIARCPRNLTMEDAEWIADEVRLANRREKLKNPAGFLIEVTCQLLRDGSTQIYIVDDEPEEKRLAYNTSRRTYDDAAYEEYEKNIQRRLAINGDYGHLKDLKEA